MWWQELKPGVYITVILLLIIIVLAIEAIRHRRALAKLSIRVHINGTRGKSSVTRLIAAGLRAGGIVTCAKTTGTLARFIFPDGREEPIYRMGHSNIAEQINIVKKAAAQNAQALIIECMSLQPLLQSICELKLIRSTHGVLTNARPDHLEIMGPLEEDVALALAGTVPVAGHYFTPEIKHLAIFQHAVDDRDSTMHHITQADIDTVTDEEIEKFSYQEFKENVALALSVCEALNIDRDQALEGMWQATPDPGAMSITHFIYQGQSFIFANGFAANDPVSTEMLWSNLLDNFSHCDKTTLIVNCRSDRHERSAQLGKAMKNWQQADKILLIGSGTKTFAHAYGEKYSDNFVNGENWTATEILNNLNQDQCQKHFICGIGNIAGVGLTLIDLIFDHKETLC